MRSTASGIDALFGVDSLFNVERLKFDDGAVALDLEGAGAGGQAYRLYQAALNRSPDVKGVGFWINALDNGVTLCMWQFSSRQSGICRHSAPSPMPS